MYVCMYVCMYMRRPKFHDVCMLCNTHTHTHTHTHAQHPQAFKIWSTILAGKSGGNETENKVGFAVDEVKMLFLYTSLGGIYESAGLDELALACYS